MSSCSRRSSRSSLSPSDRCSCSSRLPSAPDTADSRSSCRAGPNRPARRSTTSAAPSSCRHHWSRTPSTHSTTSRTQPRHTQAPPAPRPCSRHGRSSRLQCSHPQGSQTFASRDRTQSVVGALQTAGRVGSAGVNPVDTKPREGLRRSSFPSGSARLLLLARRVGPMSCANPTCSRSGSGALTLACMSALSEGLS